MAGRIRVDQASLRFTIRQLGNVRVNMKDAGRAAVAAAGRVYRTAALMAISATDHTQADLDRLGNPYARRHGMLTLHAGDGGGWIRDGRHIVHRQTGRLVSSLRTRDLPDPMIGYEVWLDDSVAPYAVRVLAGDKRVLPRDPLWEAAMGPKTILEMQRAVVRELGKVLRSQAVIRFG